jgi:hypothetical protein
VETFTAKEICGQAVPRNSNKQHILILKSMACDLSAADHRIVYRSMTHGLKKVSFLIKKSSVQKF